jgi:hypothetical protein
MTPAAHRTGLAACLALLALACGGRSAEQESPDLVPVAAPARVYVTNNNHLDVRVFAFDNTQAIPLGTVASFTTMVFDLPTGIRTRGRVRIMADPVGSTTAYVTDEIVFSPGQDIEVTVQNNIALSSYAIR